MFECDFYTTHELPYHFSGWQYGHHECVGIANFNIDLNIESQTFWVQYYIHYMGVHLSNP